MNRRTRPGIDRIAMQLMKGAISAQGDMLRLHVAECHRCTVAKGNAYAHCATWWDIKTKLHQLQRQMGMAISDHMPGQDTLPGMGTGK